MVTKQCNIMIYSNGITQSNDKEGEKMGRFNLKFIIIALLATIIFGTFVSCKKEIEAGESDKKVYHLEHQISSIKDGISYATDRAKQWRPGLYLDYIKVTLNGVDEILNKKGEILYRFYEERAKDDLDADAYVLLDMKKNSIISFDSSYGTPKVLIGGYSKLDTSKWILDIDKAVDILIEKIGKDKIQKHENPNIVIRCWENYWEIAVVGNQFDDYVVTVNPSNLEIISIDDKKASRDGNVEK